MLDLVIRNGKVVDGSGMPGFYADVGIKAGKIVRIGKVIENAADEIDASGKIVSPGFIDPHTHILMHNFSGMVMPNQPLNMV